MGKERVITLETPIQYAKGVGEKRAEGFLGLGIRTCGDLLFHLPRDYLHFTDEAAVTAMKVGEMATVRGTILQTRMHRRPRARLEALLEDASGTEGGRCVLTWFNPYGLQDKIVPGALLRVTGKVTVYRNRNQMVQPKVEYLEGKDEEVLAAKTARLEPVYAATADLASPVIWRVIKGMLEPLISQLEEWFPEKYLEERQFFTRREAMRKIHHPLVLKDAITAKRTLAYHEFFLHQAAVAIRRYQQRHGNPAIPLRVDEAVDRRIRALLPFELTGAQNHVIESIRKDLGGTKPMNRLLQGDVGSGKTVVALYAMLAAVATRKHEDTKATKFHEGIEEGFVGHQGALMAPTEILAEQHFITLTELLRGKKVKVGLLTGSVTGAERRAVLSQIAEGQVGIVVGTHALLGEAVRFKSLAVIVIDEQHKFGVEQRSAIREKQGAITPHTLVMTATPIPRTLAMTAFGDLDVSVIDALPPGRQPIFTRMTPSSNREEVYAWLAKKVAGGEQAYVVTPAIDEGMADSEFEPAEVAEADAQSGVHTPPAEPGANMRTAVGVHRELERDLLKGLRVGVMHGRMARETRQHIMERFRQKLIDVLVSTTVIEVGVDVPNACVMVVENADRFGLSQLHQLRGRVGRGPKQSHCILLADLATDDAVKRLGAMVKHTSGFQIAEEDLKLRGMGQLIGTAQSGRTNLHFAELLFDPHLLPMSRRDAFNVVAADPRLMDAGHRELRGAILEKFADSISLADVG